MSAGPGDPPEFCIHHDGQGGGAHYSLSDGASDLGKPADGLNDHVWSVKDISGSSWRRGVLKAVSRAPVARIQATGTRLCVTP
ncbi:hypothetical protein [Streptomyces sp. TLI_185]|uniref:hypothetical protein n=1 Tax=Streptomyces sp. TLI_185 TaxID=2485151 RepID=UPI000F4D641E|nr:hypothetical protein [Streptomyces sp. TLI_185]